MIDADDAELCRAMKCADYKCTEAMVYREPGSNDKVGFCKKDTDCVDGVANDLGDKCFAITSGHFAWDGTNCK